MAASPNGRGISPLAAACAFDAVAVGKPPDPGAVNALLLYGGGAIALLQHRDRNGATALMVAAHCGNVEALDSILGVLEKEGEGRAACISATDENGATALWLAAAGGHAPAVKALLDAGAGKCLFLSEDSFRNPSWIV